MLDIFVPAKFRIPHDISTPLYNTRARRNCHYARATGLCVLRVRDRRACRQRKIQIMPIRGRNGVDVKAQT